MKTAWKKRLIALVLVLGLAAACLPDDLGTARASVYAEWKDYMLQAESIAVNPDDAALRDLTAQGTVVRIRMKPMGQTVKTSDLEDVSEDFYLRDSNKKDWPLYSVNYRGVTFDAATGSFGLTETQNDFDLIFVLTDTPVDALEGARLRIPINENETGIIQLEEIPVVSAETAAEESAEAAAEEPVNSDVSFVLDGFCYTITALNDNPDDFQATLMGNQGHSITFSLPAGTSGYADSESHLYQKARVIEPSGNSLSCYCNRANDANPYTLYFNLSSGILLEYCLFQIESDTGLVTISLSDVGQAEPAAPAEAPVIDLSTIITPAPIPVPAQVPAPVFDPAPVEEAPQPTEEPAREEPTEEPTPKQTEAPVEETIAEATSSALDLSRYGNGNSVENLLSCADEALSDGFDAKTVSEALSAYAEQNGLLQSLLYAGENLAAYDSNEYLAVQNVCSGHSMELYRESPYQMLDDSGLDVYTVPDASAQVKALFANEEAQFCLEPCFWSESGFRRAFGTEFKKFKPSAPRAGYVCLILDDDSETDPASAWYDGCDDDDELLSSMRSAVNSLMGSLRRDAPVVTGNPNLASEFWIYSLKYPFRGWYGSNNKKEVKGYNCSASLKIVDAVTHKTIAEVSSQNRLGNTIYEWHNWIAQADVPDLSEKSTYTTVVNKTRDKLVKERSLAMAESPITLLNADSALNGKLYSLAESAKNVWEKAIYAAGARDVVFEGDELSFSLRSFNPDTDSISADADDPEAWLRQALDNTAAYDLTVTVKVEGGKISDKDLKALQQTVKKAGATAKTAFADKDFTGALTAALFPEVTDAKVKEAVDLQPDEAFLSSLPARESSENSSALAALFYTQTSQKASAADGPAVVNLTCKGAEPEALLQDSALAILDTLAYQPVEERTVPEDLETEYLNELAENAIALRKNGKNTFSVAVNLDELRNGALPEDYEEYLRHFCYAESYEELRSAVENLPDIAALPYPASKALSGAKSGTTVSIEIPKHGTYTYVQLRNADTNELAASAFVHPGKKASMKVPKGRYIILWCGGRYWYGEELFFGKDTVFQKSESTQINSSCAFTLEPSDDGDINIYGANAEEFR